MKRVLNLIITIIKMLISNLIKYFIILNNKNIVIGKRVVLLGKPIITTVKNSKIQIGEGSVIDSLKYKNPLGLNKKSILRTLKEGALINIGKNVGMSGVTICCMERVEIGDNVGIGANTTIVDTNFHPTDPLIPKSEWDNISLIRTAPVIIEENVMIGMNVTILKGVRIGKNSVIGAGCFIAKNIEANSVYVTNSILKIK